MNGTDFIRRNTFDKIADRNETIISGNPQLVNLCEVATGVGIANTNVNLILSVIRTILTNLDTVGHELNHAADQRDVRAKLGCLRSVYLYLPLDAG